jgi:hypothetical protein
MDLTIEAKAGLVMEAIKEDRAEIRSARDRIYAGVAQVAIASFAITAYLIGKDAPAVASAVSARWWLPLIDVSFLILLWALFIRAKRDLDIGRLCLEAREQMLRDLAPGGPFDIYAPVDTTKKPKINEDALIQLAAWTSVVLLAKLAVVCVLVWR